MIITKIFTGEMSHIVRNCTSIRCSHSIHGHSFKLEVSITADKLDNGGMLMDFGLMKGSIKQFIDSFDHCHVLWNKDKKDYRDFIKSENARWIELGVNPSAECLSMFFFYWIQEIIDHTEFKNGESRIKVYSVKYHETTTGSATCFEEDLVNNSEVTNLLNFSVSKGVWSDWDNDLYSFMFNNKYESDSFFFKNPSVKLQVKNGQKS